jgi:hypothetical protein
LWQRGAPGDGRRASVERTPDLRGVDYSLPAGDLAVAVDQDDSEVALAQAPDLASGRLLRHGPDLEEADVISASGINRSARRSSW